MAAWNIDQIYSSIKFIIRKSQAGGISATDLFYAWNIEQRDYHSDLVGRFQPKGNTKSGTNTGLIENELILTKLAPFTKNANIVVAAGLGPKPADFIYLLSLQVSGSACEYYEHDQKSFIVDSVIDPPSVADGACYYTEYEGNYNFLPNTITSASIDYISDVVDVIWAFTLDGAGRQVYDSGTSVQPLWDNDSIIEITKRSLTQLGVSFKDADFTNFGRTAQQTGD